MEIRAEDLKLLVMVMEDNNFSVSEVISLIKRNTSLKNKESIVKTINNIIMTIDYSKTIPELFVLGRYDWKNSGITKRNFPKLKPFSGKFKLSARLFNFSEELNTKVVTNKIKKIGYYPASLFELLWLGFQYPNLQKLFPIVALGSIWREGRSKSIPYLDSNGKWRGLALNWLDEWSSEYRFLGLKRI